MPPAMRTSEPNQNKSRSSTIHDAETDEGWEDADSDARPHVALSLRTQWRRQMKGGNPKKAQKSEKELQKEGKERKKAAKEKRKADVEREEKEMMDRLTESVDHGDDEDVRQELMNMMAMKIKHTEKEIKRSEESSRKLLEKQKKVEALQESLEAELKRRKEVEKRKKEEKRRKEAEAAAATPASEGAPPELFERMRKLGSMTAMMDIQAGMAAMKTPSDSSPSPSGQQGRKNKDNDSSSSGLPPELSERYRNMGRMLAMADIQAGQDIMNGRRK